MQVGLHFKRSGDGTATVKKAMCTKPGVVVAALCYGVSIQAARPAIAQSGYPSKSVQIVVPYVAGGGADVVVRALAQQLVETWGKNVAIDNRAGASGMIGTEFVAKAEPDGHTLLGQTSGYPATAAIRKRLPFDPANSLVAVE